MSESMNLTGADAERLADAIEAAATRDLYAAAPPQLRARSLAIGGATALIVPTLPVTYFNRVIGLGNVAPAATADIARVAAEYTAANVHGYWIHLSPCAQPPELPSLLEIHGFALPTRRSWAKFLREVQTPPSTRTQLVVREAGLADAGAVAAVLCTAYGMPPAVGPWFGALIGRPGWRVWVAEKDGRVVATGALFIDRDTGWLGAGATLAEYRGLGAQSALLAARIAAASDAGCRIVATETGEPVDAERNPSLGNIQRAGFAKVCSRLNYGAPSISPQAMKI